MVDVNLGVMLMVGPLLLWLIIYTLQTTLQAVWGWIDDGDYQSVDFLKSFINKLGIKNRGGWNEHERFIVALYSFEIVGTFVYFYPLLGLMLGGLVLMAYLARFARRTYKLLKKHIDNKSLHN